MGNSIKEQLYEACNQAADQRILNIQQRLDSIQESKNNETKSSAGDKFETGRAMMQIEEQKSTIQLADANRVKMELERISLQNEKEEVTIGSLVYTSSGIYFLSIGIGKITVDDVLYYCISKDAPIATQLQGKRNGAVINFNGRSIVIEKIV